MVDKKDIRFILDPLGERNTDGIETFAVDLGNAYLAETSDPQRRYVPSVSIITKDREPIQEVAAVQVSSDWQWSFRTETRLETAPLQRSLIASVTLGTLHQRPELAAIATGFNLLMPLLTTIDDNQVFDLYRTPGKATFLLLPQGFVNNGEPKLAAPAAQNGFLDQYVIVSFLAPPGTAITNYLRYVTNIPVTDFAGISKTDLDWTQLKVKEANFGLPQDYQLPQGITQDAVNWLNFDKNFNLDLLYLKIERVDALCVEQTKLNKVVAQDPPAGISLNAMNQKITLSICNQVVSQAKYETLTYVTQTPTITPTPTLTYTLYPTSTPTLAPSLTPTKTTKPSNTPKPSSTVQPSSTASKPAATGTTGPTSTTGPTNTPTPVIKDEFSTTSIGYDASIWTLVDSGVGSRTWRSGENTLRQDVSEEGDYNLKSVKQCLFGYADMRIKSYEETDGRWIVGWVDNTDQASIQNGVYLASSTDSANVVFTVYAYGVAQTANVAVSNRDTSWHTYRIGWAMATDGSYNVTANLYIDGSSTPSASFSTGAPDSRLPFMVTTYMNVIPAIPGAGNAWLDLDYVRIVSSSCQ